MTWDANGTKLDVSIVYDGSASGIVVTDTSVQSTWKPELVRTVLPQSARSASSTTLYRNTVHSVVRYNPSEQ